jgi:branched-chain amino acid transport system ATP-binding protein
MIEIKNVSKSFGGIKAVNDVSLNIKQGSITGLIGPNGAGKTTLFNIIAGLYHADVGEITFEKTSISGLRSDQLFEKGILRTFQIAHEFENLSVRENLMMVPVNQIGENILHTWMSRRKIKQQEKTNYEKASEVMKFLNLDHIENDRAGSLSGGQKKLLELGRTMMVDAKLVLLDEVGAGVNKTLLKKIGQSIKTLNSELGYTFFMIEHDIDFISSLCDPVIVMTEGSVLTKGKVEDIKNDDRVIEAYLGN